MASRINLGSAELFYIFSSLEPKDLANVSQACKEWNQLANDNVLWKNLFIKTFGTLEVSKFECANWKEGFKIKKGGQYLEGNSFPILSESAKIAFRLNLTVEDIRAANTDMYNN